MSPQKKKCGVCGQSEENEKGLIPFHEGAYLDLEGEIQERPICEDCVNAMDPCEQCKACERWFHEGPGAAPFEDVVGRCEDCDITVCDECLLDHLEDHP